MPRLGRSSVEAAMERVWFPVAPLFTITDVSSRLSRRAFGGSLAIGAGTLAVGHVMDWLVFASMPRPLPAYFVALIGVWLAMAMPSLCARRLRDAGFSRKLVLLLVAPPMGWLALAYLLARPGRENSAGALTGTGLSAGNRGQS